MKFKSISFVFIITCILTGTGYSEYRGGSDNIIRTAPISVKETIVIKFKKNISADIKKSILKKTKTKKIGEIRRAGADIIKIPPGNTVSKAVHQFSKRNDVIYAEPVYIKRAFILPAEYTNKYELKEMQWGLEKIKAPEGWTIETGEGVVVAVLDTGIDMDHPDLAGNIWNNPNPESLQSKYSKDSLNYEIKYDTHGWDFVNNDNNPDDDSCTGGHGTHCAGIIAAEANNLRDSISGVSWHNRLMSVKVLDSEGFGTSVDAARGIYYAADRGAKVINMSFGGPESRVEKEALDYAYNKGCVLVAAAGNDSSPEISYPAAHEYVIAAGASNADDKKAGFSNYGNGLDLVAPGTNIYSTCIGDYGNLSGTSMACPFVSGLASLVISFWNTGNNPNWIPQQVKNAIISNCDNTEDSSHSGWNKYTGYGRINIKKTLESISSLVVNIVDDKILVYPNPFNPYLQNSIIVLPKNYNGAAKKLRVYSLDGQEVRELEATENKALWNGKNNDGEICANGLYFYYLDTTTGGKKGKITLLR